jgi:hypothetical protein
MINQAMYSGRFLAFQIIVTARLMPGQAAHNDA